ncbi:LOW QUALITY PROTEIN: zinc finger HIT domain-containing protein 2-like [Ruditapes philippinarum]|uniref:LOW QUALITY PROTEIN: zinc finger HIT domain-containing protein 2-like n=1 Tax=Ruditapes philippinarum TaxID=129788 RepID=UPI00295C1A05|nr:LOW QUALITY PROTEIN: zinc finger HIT domain-containing protein 2-like [Ruditapes philippinarum]
MCLKDFSADAEDKQKVLDMLKRAETDPDLNDLDEPEDDLHERLHDLDLDRDTREVWNRLTDQEKKEFDIMVGDGRLGNLVEIWTPWWIATASLVTESLKEVHQVQSQGHSVLCQIFCQEIPNISNILKSKPSADVKYNVINVLFVYCYVCRLHNRAGYHGKQSVQQTSWKLSDVLGEGHTCGSVDEAVQFCMRKLVNKQQSLTQSPEFNISILKDIELIITGIGENEPLKYLMAALSEICQIFKKAYKSVCKKAKVGGKTSLKETLNRLKSTYFQVLKKCEFYLSWTQTSGMALHGMIPELQIVNSLLSVELESVNQSKRELEEQWGGNVKPRRKKLIEEM